MKIINVFFIIKFIWFCFYGGSFLFKLHSFRKSHATKLILFSTWYAYRIKNKKYLSLLSYKSIWTKVLQIAGMYNPRLKPGVSKTQWIIGHQPFNKLFYRTIMKKYVSR